MFVFMVGTILLFLFLLFMLRWAGLRFRHVWIAIHYIGVALIWLGAVCHDLSASIHSAEDAAKKEWVARREAERTGVIAWAAKTSQ